MVEYRLNEDGILVEVDSNLGMMEEIEAEQVTETSRNRILDKI